MCVGSAIDIFQAGRPPRATFVDYPLGHSSGKPFDTADQLSIRRHGGPFGDARPNLRLVALEGRRIP